MKLKSIEEIGKAIEEEPKEVKNGEWVIAFMELQKPIVCETYSTYPSLGRFAVRDMKRTVAVGVIRDINRKEKGFAEKNIKEDKKKKNNLIY